MDVSAVIAAQAAKYKSVAVEKETPPEVDAGLLTVTDLNPIDEESYKANLEEYLQSTARDGVQLLFAAVFALPTRSSADGPQAILPPRSNQLPRAKHLPKPKPMTKWQKFADAKGIQHKKRQRHEFDEEKQEWVSRWGKGGKNREAEEQWLHEVPANAPDDYDPRKTSRDERKERIAKNKQQEERNKAHAQASQRKTKKEEVEQTILRTRVSTASMGKFDKKLQGEPKLRGVKRKFEATESVKNESANSMAILSKMESDAKKTKVRGGDDVLNVRKAVRYASGGKGSAALAREGDRGKGAKGKGKKGRR